MLTQPGIAMPKFAPGDGGDKQPPRQTLTGFSFEENDPEQQHTHVSTTEHADGSIEPNLATLTEPELYALIRKSLASFRRYDWNPETGWEEVRS